MLATLQLAADAPGFRADGRLALPTADGGLAPLRACVVDDAPWLLRRMRPGAVRLVSAVGPLLQAQLGLRPLSAAVREELVTEAVTEAHADAASAAAGAGWRRGAAAAAWAGVVDAGGAPGAGGGAGRLEAHEATVEFARAEALTARLHFLEPDPNP